VLAGTGRPAHGTARYDRGDLAAARRPRGDSPIVAAAASRCRRPVRVARQLPGTKGVLARPRLRTERQRHDRSVKRLVVTADDFGLSLEVNEAVRRAHREGILTCASLMVGAPAVANAVTMAKADGLPVGLHLTLVDGRPVLPPERVPDLVDDRGAFRAGLRRPAVRLALSRGARRQAREECEAQIAAFMATGLNLDHLNAHHHFHVHPSVLAIVVELARRHRVPAVRVPFEPVVPPYRSALLAATVVPWSLRARHRLRRRRGRTPSPPFAPSVKETDTRARAPRGGRAS